VSAGALNASEIARLNAAERKRDDVNLPMKARQNAVDQIAGIERQRRQKADDIKADADAIETRSLGEARGEEVATSKVSATKTRLRVISRDGLAYLYDAGLTQRRYDAGMIYRRAHEGAQARGTTAAYGERIAGGDGSEAAAVRAKCDLQRARMEELCHNTRELFALRFVAGEGRTIRSFATSGTARKSYMKALLAALDRVADHNGLRAY
jgi:hypothetical protein